MSHKTFSSVFAALALLCAAATARADVRIKQRMTTGGHAMESDVAIKGARQRTEMEPMPGMKTVTLTQCDLRRTLQLSEATRKYTVTPMDDAGDATAPKTATASAAPAGRVTRGGVVTYVQTLTDTGERKQVFGMTARHIKMSVRTESSPDACNKTDMRYESDGWYVDLDVSFECAAGGRPAAPQMAARPSGCQDQIRFRNVGTAKLGYPLDVTTRFFNADGSVMSEMRQEVVSLARATLDPALFDVPAGYVETKNPQELYDMAAMMKAAQGANRERNDGEDAGARPAGEGAGMGAASGGAGEGATGAKRPGVVRVGVVRLNNRTTQSLDAGNLRGMLIASLTDGTVEAVALEETVADAAQAEAKVKECDFVLFTDVATLKQSAANKIGGLLGRATGAGDVRDRFEAKIDYTLVPVDGGAPTKASVSTKEEGAADVSLNSALRKEAQAVLAKVRK